MCRIALLAVALVVLFPLTIRAAETTVVFEDKFDGKLGEGWTWLRENPQAWRIRNKGLEIRVEPGFAESVKNALVRDAVERDSGPHAYEVTVSNLTHPTQQWEQVGITWYHAGKPAAKLVKEWVDEGLYVFPGKAPIKNQPVRLRFVVDGDKYTAQYRLSEEEEFKTLATGTLPPKGDGKDQVSIQCYHGPPDAEHWMRFEDFRCVRFNGAQ